MFSGLFKPNTSNKSYTLSEVDSGLMNNNMLKRTQSTLTLTNLRDFKQQSFKQQSFKQQSSEIVKFTADAVYNTIHTLGPIVFTFNPRTKHIYSESPGLIQGRIFTSNELYKGGARRASTRKTRNRRMNKRKSRRSRHKKY
jgi:hypothetical protein